LANHEVELAQDTEIGINGGSVAKNLKLIKTMYTSNSSVVKQVKGVLFFFDTIHFYHNYSHSFDEL